VNEPTVEQTVQILRGLKSKFEEHHNVKYSASALTTAAELSARFINDRHLPDKAIDVIDEPVPRNAFAEIETKENHRQSRH
jgi:ATP-dependent Clp protease ATP-binding subunit ClpA